MPDQNLSGDDLKLVRYKVLFVKRDYEYAFREQEELVHEDLRGEDFTSWKIAEFIQSLHKNKVAAGDKKKPRSQNSSEVDRQKQELPR